MFKKLKDNLKKYLQFLVFSALGIVIICSLLSYNSEDNAVYNFNSTLESYNNFFGYPGSLISDILLRAFGYSSYFLPIFFFLNGFRLLSNMEIKWYSWSSLPFLIIFTCFFLNFLDNKMSFFGIQEAF